jgi:hypothetical protein
VFKLAAAYATVTLSCKKATAKVSEKGMVIWQAFGLLVLSRLLFGSFPSGWMARKEMARHHRHPLYEKWAEMNEKEREEFIKNRHHGFHGYPFGHGHSHSENNSEQ